MSRKLDLDRIGMKINADKVIAETALDKVSDAINSLENSHSQFAHNHAKLKLYGAQRLLQQLIDIKTGIKDDVVDLSLGAKDFVEPEDR